MQFFFFFSVLVKLNLYAVLFLAVVFFFFFKILHGKKIKVRFYFMNVDKYLNAFVF